MRRLLIGSVAAYMLFAGTAQAYFSDGNDLFGTCTENDFYSKGSCLGYVAGAVDMLNKSCLPNVTLGQMRDIC